MRIQLTFFALQEEKKLPVEDIVFPNMGKSVKIHVEGNGEQTELLLTHHLGNEWVVRQIRDQKLYRLY